jgi:hypothetical protein
MNVNTLGAVSDVIIVEDEVVVVPDTSPSTTSVESGAMGPNTILSLVTVPVTQPADSSFLDLVTEDDISTSWTGEHFAPSAISTFGVTPSNPVFLKKEGWFDPAPTDDTLMDVALNRSDIDMDSTSSQIGDGNSSHGDQDGEGNPNSSGGPYDPNDPIV